MLVIPPNFAAGGGQASALGGFVQMYSAQNPAFLNSIQNPLAPTANLTGVSNLTVELSPKQLELLRELVPSASVIAVLLNSANPNAGDLR